MKKVGLSSFLVVFLFGLTSLLYKDQHKNTLKTDLYELTVNRIIQFHPNEIQSKLMRWNDTIKDYFILDCSLTSHSDSIFDSGREMMSAYFVLNDRQEIPYSFKGTTVIGSYNTQHKQEYSQKEYDKIWGKAFPAKTSSRAHVFGIEVPEGKKIVGFGFHQKKPTKRTYSELIFEN
jgi:hypothetical protein